MTKPWPRRKTETNYPYYRWSSIHSNRESKSYTVPRMALMVAMRQLWEEFVFYTGMLSNALTYRLPEETILRNRTHRVANEVAGTFHLFYGPDKGAIVERFFKEQVRLNEQWLAAYLQNNQPSTQQIASNIKQSGEKFAFFLSSINPYWRKDELVNYFDQLFLYYTLIVENQNKRDFTTMMKFLDEREKWALQLSDYLVDGIVVQFPEEFK